MRIFVNGEPRDLPTGATVREALELLDVGHRRVAVEVNLEIVPHSEHSTRVLEEGDRVEIVHAIGGG